ncbi:tetratricopeptide repeat protein [Undibacterium macrobrachii]|uniref:Protein kinase domain-containing protein n=1 Tax=Undibacterium macrobrachii TaxID=1119058 RepID=A0ABQ2XEP2_9BURK|nr:tetratricopeptide repeat protein [Undibacterium macrobrachii]GGX13850.1 hypothetical protein GCM10011282_19970 [Undibacterium macrobrachii]
MVPSTFEFRLPDSLQHYRLDVRISDSDLFSVYQAWDSKLQRTVLIHAIRYMAAGSISDGASDDHSLNLLYLQRARQVAALQHPAFSRIHALEEFDRYFILITEAIQGKSLVDLVQRSALDTELALKYVRHLATALHEAHAVGLVHGNLHNANLVQDNLGMLRMSSIEFVLHQSIDLRIDGLPECSPSDPRRDVYSLGLLLLALVTGRFSHPAQVSPQDMALSWPDKLPQEIRKLIVDMTTQQAEQFLTSQQVIERCSQILSEYFHSTTSSAINLPKLKQDLQEMRNQRRRHTLAITALLVVLTGVGIWQLPTYFPKLISYLTPFSESNELAQAARDLTEYTYKTDAKLLDAAEAHLQKILQRNSEHAAAVAYTSILYLSKYNAEKRDEIWFQKAKAGAQRAMTLNGELAISLIAQAKVLQWHHRLDEALDLSSRARKLDPDNLLAWHSQVSVLLEMRQFSEAIPLAMEGANKFPRDRYLLDLQGGMYLSQKKFNEAEAVLNTSLQRQPDSPLAYSLLAECLTLQERNVEALRVIQQGLQVRPNVNLYSALANAKFRAGEYADAAAAFSQTVSRDKGVAGSYLRWFEYAESLMWVEGRENDAVQAYQRALELLDIRFSRSPDDATLLSIKSMIMARLNDFPQATTLANRTIARKSEDPYVHFWLAYTFELLQQREQALAELKLSKHFGIPNQMLETHPGLRSLREDPRFASL